MKSILQESLRSVKLDRRIFPKTDNTCDRVTHIFPSPHPRHLTSPNAPHAWGEESPRRVYPE